MLFFIHIPKTAGTTWRSILYRQYADGKVCPVYDGDGWFYSRREVQRLSETRRGSYDAVVGHIGVSQASLFRADSPPKLSTLVRDPVERCMSLIRHLQAHFPEQRGKTAHEILDGGNPQFRNHQTRMLCSRPTPPGRPDAGSLDQALGFVEGLAHLGISERFHESFALACRQLDWQPVPFLRLNSGAPLIDSEGTKIRIRERLHEMNALDVGLYQHCLRQFSERVDQHRSKDPRGWEALMDRIKGLEGVESMSRSQGAVGRVVHGTVHGWARLLQSDQPAVVQALWGGHVVAECEARDRRPRFAEKGVEPAGRCGFSLDVAAALRERGQLPGDIDNTAEIEVKIRQTGSYLKYRGNPRIPLHAST